MHLIFRAFFLHFQVEERVYTAGWKWACTKEKPEGDNAAFLRLFDYITGDNVESKTY